MPIDESKLTEDELKLYRLASPEQWDDWVKSDLGIAPLKDYTKIYKTQEEIDAEPGVLTRGLMGEGVYGSGSLITGAAGLAADALGFDDTAQSLLEKSQSLSREGQEKYPRKADFDQVLDDPSLSNIWEWLGYGVAGTAPLMLGAMGVGGLAGVGAKAALRKAAVEAGEAAVKRATAAELESLGAEKIAQMAAGKILDRAVTIGAGAGAASFAPVEAGGMWIDDAEKHGVENTSPWQDALAGSLSASLEMLGGEGMLLRRALGGAGGAVAGKTGRGVTDILKGIAAGGAEGFLREGGEEALQEMVALGNEATLARPGEVPDLMTDRGFKRIAESGLIGGFSGLGPGTVSGGIHGLRHQASQTDKVVPEVKGTTDILGQDGGFEHQNDTTNPFVSHEAGFGDTQNINQYQAQAPRNASQFLDLLDQEENGLSLSGLSGMNPQNRQLEMLHQSRLNPSALDMLKQSYMADVVGAGFPSDVTQGAAAQSAGVFENNIRQTELGRLAGLLTNLSGAKQQAEDQAREAAIVQSPIGSQLLADRLRQEELASSLPEDTTTQNNSKQQTRPEVAPIPVLSREEMDALHDRIERQRAISSEPPPLPPPPLPPPPVPVKEAAKPEKTELGSEKDEAFKNVIHARGLVIGKPGDGSHITENGYTYRSVGVGEIDAIRREGQANPPAKSKGGRQNVKHWTRMPGKQYYRNDQNVIRVKDDAISTDSPVQAKDIELWNPADNSWKPINEGVEGSPAITDTAVPEATVKPEKKLLDPGTKIEWNDKKGNTLAGTITGIRGSRYEIERENPQPGQGKKTFLHTDYNVRELQAKSYTEKEAIFSGVNTEVPETQNSNYNSVADEVMSEQEQASIPDIPEESKERLTPKNEALSLLDTDEAADTKEEAATPIKNPKIDRLEATARKLIADADARANADRLTNTSRRAGMAENAIKTALADKRIGETMLKVADHIRSGESQYLTDVTSKTDITQLNSIMRRAVYETERKTKTYANRDDNRKFSEADVDNIEYPYPVIHTSDLYDVAKSIKGKKGSPAVSNKIDAIIRRYNHNGSFVKLTDESGVESTREILKHVSDPYLKKRIQERISSYDRMKRIGLYDISTLKKAVGELASLDSGIKKENSVKALEREIYSSKNIGLDFFPTSKEVAADLAERLDVKPGMDVLEPSAGSGRLIDAVKEKEPGAKIDAVEQSSKLRELLNARGDNVVDHDFMDLDKDKTYDRIIMNPPFSNGLDIDHVRKAYDHLKPGGKIVAIMGEGAFFRNDKKASGFREWLDEVGGSSEKLPEGSFNHKDMVQKTGVNSRVVEIEKPGSIESEQPVKKGYGRRLEGIKGVSYLPDNTAIDHRYIITESSDPVASHDDSFNENDAYPQEIQPRERGKRDALKLQVEGMANNIIPEKIGESASLSSGAPVVGNDGVVESGNGRIMAVRKAYSNGKAENYRKWLVDNAERFGFKKEDVQAMKQPVMLRERLTEVEDRSLFAKQANKDEVARMSASEDAAADAELIDKDDMKVFAPSEEGDIGAYSNRAFVNRFLNKLPASERSGYVTEDGRATRQLVDRMRSAVFHKAYNDKVLTSLAAEESNPDIKNIINGLLAAAPDFVKARAIDTKLGDAGVIEGIVEAVDIIRRARSEFDNVTASEGKTKLLVQVESSVNQPKLFSKDNETHEGKRLAVYMATNVRSAKRLGLFLKHLASSVKEYLADLKQARMFGEKYGFSLINSIDDAERALSNEGQEEQELWGNNPRNGQADERNKQAGHRRTASQVMERDSEGYEDSRGDGSDRLERPGKEGLVRKNTTPLGVDFETLKTEKTPGRGAWNKVDVQTTGYIAAKGLEVKTHEDAAALVAGLKDSPQENLYFICVNKDGIVTEVNRHSVGTNKASFHDNTVIASRVFANPETSVVYTAHNHPGGSLEPSDADLKVLNRLQKILNTRDIKTHGIIVGKDSFTVYDRDNISDPAPFPETVAETKIPVVERVMVQHSDGSLGKIRNRADFEKVAEKVGNRAFVFMDGTLNVVGVMPFPAGMNSKELASLVFQKAGEVNASRYAVVTDRLTDSSKDFIAALQGKEHELELMDVIVDGKSVVKQGEVIEPDGRGMETINKGFPVYSVADKKPAGGVDVAELSKNLEYAGRRMPFEAVKSEDELPHHIKKDIENRGYQGRAEAVFDPETGKVYFIADNIGSVKAGQTSYLENLIRHEGRHAAISQMFESSGSRNLFMDRAAKLFKSDVAAYMKKNGMEDTKENTRIAAEEALVEQAVKGGVHALLDEFMGKVVRWARKIFPNLSMTRAEARAFIRRADSALRVGDFAKKAGFSGKPDGKGVLDTEKEPVKYSLKDRPTSLKDLGIATEYSEIKTLDENGGMVEGKKLVISGNFRTKYDELMKVIGGKYRFEKKAGAKGVTARNIYEFKNPPETIEKDIAEIIRAHHGLEDMGLKPKFRESEKGTSLFINGDKVHLMASAMKKIGGKFVSPTEPGRKPFLVFNNPDAAKVGKIAAVAKESTDSLARMQKIARDTAQNNLNLLVKPKDESAKAAAGRVFDDLKSLFSKSGITLPSNNTDFVKGLHWVQTEIDIARNDTDMKALYDINERYNAIATQVTTQDRDATKDYYELDKEERKAVNEALLAGDEERVKLTDGVVKERFGLSDKQVKGFRAIRNVLDNKLVQIVNDMVKHAFSDLYLDDDTAREILSRKIVDSLTRNEVTQLLKEYGVDPKEADKVSWLFDWINERKGYIPHKWDSEWLVRVNMPDGETYLLDVPTVTGNILPTKALREGAANKAAIRVIKERIGWSDEQIQEWIDQGNIRLVKSKKMDVDLFHGASMHTMNAIIDSATEKAWEENKDAFSTEQLMKQDDLKKAIRKEMEELFLAKGAGRHFIARKGVKGFRTDIDNILAEYIGGINHWMVKRDKAMEFSKAMKSIDPKETPVKFKHARAFVDDMLGESSEASWFKRFAGTWFLGADVSAAALNGFQNFTHAAPLMMNIKGKESVYSQLGKAMKDAFAEWKAAKNEDRPIFTGESKFVSKEEAGVVRDLYEQGFFDPAVVGEQTGFHPSSVWNNYADVGMRKLMFMFTGVESLNRASSFLAAYRRAKAAGLADPVKAARDVVIGAHFAAGKENRPLLVRRMGALGNIGYTFMMFPVNNFFFLKNIFKDAFKAIHGGDKEKIKTSLKVVGAHLGALMSIGGLSALPFASVLAPLIKGIFSDDDDDWEVALRKHLPGNLGRAAVRGIPAVFGNDMSGRISGDITGMPAGFGVIQTMAKRANKAGMYLSQGETLDAAMILMPDFIRNPYNAVMGMREGGEKRGRSPVKYTGWQAFNKALGFSPTDETEAYAAKQSIDNVKAKRSDMLESFAEDLNQLRKKGNTAAIASLRKKVAEYNSVQAKDSDPVIKWSDVLKSAKQREKMRNKGYMDRVSKGMKGQKKAALAAFEG